MRLWTCDATAGPSIEAELAGFVTHTKSLGISNNFWYPGEGVIGNGGREGNHWGVGPNGGFPLEAPTDLRRASRLKWRVCAERRGWK
jgi:hypothetical protein